MAAFFMRKASTAELDVFYPIRPECQADVPPTRFKLRAGKTLSARRWHAAFSQDGHLDIAPVLRRIQRGDLLSGKTIDSAKESDGFYYFETANGVHPSIKGAVWEFLLGCYDPNSTFEERNIIRRRRREQYEKWKAECQKMVPVIGSGKFITTPIVTDDGQPIEDSNGYFGEKGVMLTSSAGSDKKVIQWMLSLHQIGLDVVRTDQPLVFYERETNQAKLWDIQAVYTWTDQDIGYVQGMNDICSPMVILFEDEADAFWCYERAMRRLRENFRTSTGSIGVQTQLSTLSQIIKAIDPKLHEHLEDLDGGQYLFAFRMLMVLFRREFSFVDSLYLWELMWAMEYSPKSFSSYEGPTEADTSSGPKVDSKLLKQCGKFQKNYVKTGCTDHHSNAFAVYLVASVLETKNKQLLKEATGLDDVVQIIGNTTRSLDAKKACAKALKIHKKYVSKQNQKS